MILSKQQRKNRRCRDKEKKARSTSFHSEISAKKNRKRAVFITKEKSLKIIYSNIAMRRRRIASIRSISTSVDESKKNMPW